MLASAHSFLQRRAVETTFLAIAAVSFWTRYWIVRQLLCRVACCPVLCCELCTPFVTATHCCWRVGRMSHTSQRLHCLSTMSRGTLLHRCCGIGACGYRLT
jgi:hypothetical protein